MVYLKPLTADDGEVRRRPAAVSALVHRPHNALLLAKFPWRPATRSTRHRRAGRPTDKAEWSCGVAPARAEMARHDRPEPAPCGPKAACGLLETPMRERLLAQDIVATSREPLLILDQRLTVLMASRSFGAAFNVDEEAIVGLPLVRIANGRLNIPPLTEQLLRVASGETFKDFEVRQDTASGPRTFLIHADALGRDGSEVRLLMLTIEDVTERRKLEADSEDAMRRAGDMLVELNHRAMNSFAMIGAILSMEARLQQDELCRAAFTRMQGRIASIAHLYRTLGRGHSSEAVGSDEYLKTIVDDLIASLSDPSCKVEASFSVDKTRLPVRLAVPVGLIVNEIVTNSLKHAFTDRAHGRISIEFAPVGEHHVLRIADDGRGCGVNAGRASGLGRRLSETFARQLRGTVEHTSGPDGTTVVLRFPRADMR